MSAHMTFFVNNFFYIAFMALLAGCAAQNDAAYPSLSPRPIEKNVEEWALSKPDIPLKAPDSSLKQRLATLKVQFQEADSAIRTAQRNLPTTATHAAPGSESWVDRQVALSYLLTKRARLNELQADLSAYTADLIRAQIEGTDIKALQNEADVLEQQANQLNDLVAKVVP